MVISDSLLEPVVIIDWSDRHAVMLNTMLMIEAHMLPQLVTPAAVM